jgi:hypothetical protein
MNVLFMKLYQKLLLTYSNSLWLGVANQVVIYRKTHKIDFYPTKWFLINKNKLIQKKVFSKSGSKPKLNLYSCDLYNVL